MKKIAILILVNFYVSVQAQIQISTNQDEELNNDAIFMDMEPIQDNDSELFDKAFDSISSGFKNFSIELLKPFLSKGIQTEIEEIQNVFDTYTKKFENSGKTSFKHIKNDGFSMSGTLGIARFRSSNQQIGDLEFMYTYKGKRPLISEILVNNYGIKYEFPLITKKIKSRLKEIESFKKMNNYQKIVEEYKYLVAISSNLEDYYHNPNNGLKRKSDFLGSLSWYSLITNNSKDAILYAERGLEAWKPNKWIYTNLALGYALDGNIEKAKELYSKYGNNWYKDNKYFKAIFLEDLKHLNSINIKIPNYDFYINLLEKM